MDEQEVRKIAREVFYLLKETDDAFEQMRHDQRDAVQESPETTAIMMERVNDQVATIAKMSDNIITLKLENERLIKESARTLELYQILRNNVRRLVDG